MACLCECDMLVQQLGCNLLGGHLAVIAGSKQSAGAHLGLGGEVGLCPTAIWPLLLYQEVTSPRLRITVAHILTRNRQS